MASEKTPLVKKKVHNISSYTAEYFLGSTSVVKRLKEQLCCFPLRSKPKLSPLFYDSDEEDLIVEDAVEGLEATREPLVCRLTLEERLSELRKLMRRHKIGVYVIPMGDEHMSEYTAPGDRRVEFLSGFSGSSGICVVTLEDPKTLSGSAALSTDGRYFIQAEKQLNPKFWKLLKQGISSYPTWQKYAIEEAIDNKFSNLVACNARLISLSDGQYFELARKLIYQDKFEFNPMLDIDLVEVVWGSERPARSLGAIYHFPLKFSGERAESKIERVRMELSSRNKTYLVVSALDEIAWLLNLRCDDDVPYLPVFFAYLVVSLNAVTLYVNEEKLKSDAFCNPLCTQELDFLAIKPYEVFFDDLSKMRTTVELPEVQIVLPNKNSISYALFYSLGQSSLKQTVTFESIVARLRASKNSVELFNYKLAQRKDSLVFILFASWIEYHLLKKKTKITEYDAACKIYSIRSKFPNFKGLSYETISSSGLNAAIIHYAPLKDDNSLIDPAKVYLLDSGAQYLEGTTDITRTYKFGYEGLEERHKRFYTLVLKGHLAVALANFPIDADTPAILDSFARQPLWNEGLDYRHGTGHGVGSFGNVHESPLYISPGADHRVFQKGAVLTDEPGLYFEGDCGFRIESELELVESQKEYVIPRNGEKFYKFEYLTKVPFCRKLIDRTFLDRKEIKWINNYHESIREEFSSILEDMEDKRAYNWLIRETEPI